MVMAEGLISEFDSPATLLSNPDSIFHGMVKEAGIIS
jgi:ABC-type multidrug transport system fused ATPase/permease subunit